MKRSYEVSYSQPDLQTQVIEADTQPRTPEDYTRAFMGIVEKQDALDTSKEPTSTLEIHANDTYIEDWRGDPVLDKIAEGVDDATVSQEQINERLLAATPESQSNPQMSWPETSIADTPTEAEIHGRYNYKLTGLGFILDAIRPHLGEENVDRWLELKRDVASTKKIPDFHDKIDKFKDLQDIVHQFKAGFDITDDDIKATMNL